MLYKTKAYRKTKTGFELITRDYICSLKHEEQVIFRDTNKPFYLNASNDGPELTYNTKNRTFSFYPCFKGKYYGRNEESATHKYCIEIISKLNSLKIKSKSSIGKIRKGEIINFTFNYIFPEIMLSIGDNWIKPDLLIYFRKPYDLALRWNRILAIEIVVSHDLNGEKLQLMKDCKIPILRIKANKKWGREKEINMSEQKKQELKKWIQNSFKKGYTAEILLDSKSKAYLENEVVAKLEAENSGLTEALENAFVHNTQLKKKKLSIENRLVDSEKSNDTLKNNLGNKVEETKKLKLELEKLSNSKNNFKRRFNILSIALLGMIFVLLLIINLK